MTQSESLPAVAELSENEIDAVAAEISSLHRRTTLELALAIGQIVVDRLYRGDLEVWRQGGAGDSSLRRLASALERRGTRGVSASSLQQAVATLDLDQRVGVRARPQLTVSHVRAVLGLPESKQEQLLGTAEAKDWTAERTEREAAKLKARLATRPGRTPLPMVVKTVGRWRRELDDRATWFAGLDTAKLSSSQAKTLAETLTAVRAHCDELLEALETPSSGPS